MTEKVNTSKQNSPIGLKEKLISIGLFSFFIFLFGGFIYLIIIVLYDIYHGTTVWLHGEKSNEHFRSIAFILKLISMIVSAILILGMKYLKFKDE